MAAKKTVDNRDSRSLVAKQNSYGWRSCPSRGHCYLEETAACWVAIGNTTSQRNETVREIEYTHNLFCDEPKKS